MRWLVLSFVAITGALNCVQSGMNAQLDKSLGQPVWAAIAVYVAGLAALLVAVAVTGAAWPGLGRMGAVPWVRAARLLGLARSWRRADGGRPRADLLFLKDERA